VVTLRWGRERTAADAAGPTTSDVVAASPLPAKSHDRDMHGNRPTTVATSLAPAVSEAAVATDRVSKEDWLFRFS